MSASGIAEPQVSFKPELGYTRSRSQVNWHFCPFPLASRGKNRLIDPNLPPFSLAYAWEKSYLAVRSMATGSGSLQARVGTAFTSSLCLLNRENVTTELLRRVHAVRDRLTRVPAKAGEGNVAATTAVMPDEEAQSIAEEIVDIFDAIAKMYGVQKVARPSEF